MSLTPEQEHAVSMATADRKAALDKAISACAALDQGETRWQFTLSDGITAKVMFHGGPPNKAQLAAFVKIFTAVAENFVVPGEQP